MPKLPALLVRHQDVLYVALLGLLVAVLGAPTLERFWVGDDPPVLAHMLKYSLAEIFFVPAVWQELSMANLTPWISLSFRLDYVLAGLNPAFFHLHHLVALWLVAVVALRLFGLFVERWLALAGVVLFLLGLPVLRIGEQLFTRHYLEGLLFCLLALYCFLQHQRSGKFGYQLFAALCYALAMTAKEIYVPLGVLFAFMASGNLHERFRQVWPYLTLLALYLVWRAYMLSGHVGGYQHGVTYLSQAFWTDVVTSFAGIPALLFGPFTLFAAALVAGVIAAGMLLKPRQLWFAILLAGLVLAPLVPLVAYPGVTRADRYLLLPWFLLCFTFIVQTHNLLRARARPSVATWTRPVAGTVCLVLALCLMDFRLVIQRSEAPHYAATDTQMRYVWTHDHSTAFMPDATIAPSYGMARALGEVKRLLDPAASIPIAVLDPLFVDPALPLVAYAADCNCMRDISVFAAHESAQLHHKLRKAPLSLSVTNNDGWIAWNFGPYDTGTYNVISDYIGNLPLPATQNGLRTQVRRELDITLRYTAPDGWVTYSPPLRLKPNGELLAWSRE
jgi:hypothetical protein